jgi:hypothetical protein
MAFYIPCNFLLSVAVFIILLLLLSARAVLSDLLLQHPAWSGARSAFYAMCTGGSFPGDKAAEV